MSPKPSLSIAIGKLPMKGGKPADDAPPESGEDMGGGDDDESGELDAVQALFEAQKAEDVEAGRDALKEIFKIFGGG